MSLYYAAMVDYCLRDMRPMAGPFTTMQEAVAAAPKIDKFDHKPADFVAVGSWFALHPAEELSPGNFSMVDGPYTSAAKAERNVIENWKELELGPGFVGRVAKVVKRHSNGWPTRVVMRCP